MWRILLKTNKLPHENTESRFQLPFTPFIGLTVDVGGAKLTISNVYWNRKENIFEVEAD